MRRNANTTVATLALLASGSTPFACEPIDIIDSVGKGRDPECQVTVIQPRQGDTSTLAKEVPPPPTPSMGDAAHGLLPWYETCGEIGPWLPEEVRDDLDNRAIRYDGKWQRHSGADGSFGATVHDSKQAGAIATFVVPATADYDSLAVGYTRAPHSGLAKVYFDEHYIETISLYSPSTQYQCERVYYLGDHPIAEHRLKVRVEGKPGGGDGAYVSLDYFVAGWVGG